MDAVILKMLSTTSFTSRPCLPDRPYFWGDCHLGHHLFSVIPSCHDIGLLHWPSSQETYNHTAFDKHTMSSFIHTRVEKDGDASISRTPSKLPPRSMRSSRLPPVPTMTSPTFPSSPSSLSSTSPSSHDTPYQLSHLRSQSRGRPSLSSPVLDEHPPDDSQTIDIRTGPEYDRTHPLPELPPLPPAKSFHHKIDSTKPPPPPTRQATFIENWIARHPRISRHRRRFALIVGISVFLVILTITLLAVFLGRNSSHGGLNPGLGGDWGGGGGGGGGDWDDGSYTSAEELRRYNKGKQRPPINRSNAPGWTNQGRGEATYYEPSLHSATGGFQPGACEFEYINSVYDHIAALNKADFGSFARLKNSPACGQCLRVVGPNGTVDVQVVDMCPGCKSGDVDLTPSAFAEIADIWRGRVKISWQRCT